MSKSNLQLGDIIELANGNKIELGESYLWIIRDYYNDDLTCITNNEYNIVKVYRPKYELVFESNLLKR